MPPTFVRLEVAAALETRHPGDPGAGGRRHHARRQELPADLEPIVWRNAVELRHARWDADISVLIAALAKSCRAGRRAARRAGRRRRRHRATRTASRRCSRRSAQAPPSS
jgi:hypothetical protein